MSRNISFLPKFKIYLVIIFHHVFASGHPIYYQQKSAFFYFLSVLAGLPGFECSTLVHALLTFEYFITAFPPSKLDIKTRNRENSLQTIRV